MGPEDFSHSHNRVLDVSSFCFDSGARKVMTGDFAIIAKIFKRSRMHLSIGLIWVGPGKSFSF